MRFMKNGEPTETYFLLHGLALLLVLVAAGTAGLSLRGSLRDVARVHVRMANIGGGVTAGSDVKARGLVVGTVDSVSGRPGDITLDVSIDDAALRRIPSSVVARVLPASVFGTSFLDLNVDTARPAPALASGDTIRQDLSAPTLELQRALDSIDQLVSALGPADLSVVLHALAASLDGKGKQLGTSIDQLDHLLSVINPRMPLFRDDVRLLRINMSTVRRLAPDLITTLDNTADIARGVVRHQKELHALLIAAIQLVDDSDHLLDATETRYARAILESAGVVDAVYDNRRGVSEQSRALNRLMHQVLSITDGGPIRLDIRLVDPGAFHYYTSRDCPRYGSSAGSNCPGN
ncbi:MCE family protein [Nocardioides jiangxiensis]|uniref:MCE family protein n=1 Tax=Nocardioides jiangxiensis TaxID=3064524 RepID=A0ABT9AZ71_9ACTN|nr:MCE family protein [Nocardioides sp. WY-20]MDO7867253.1 MCE family protein [Nocardioides sp. WY-20]